MIKNWIKRHPDSIYFAFFALIFLIACVGILTVVTFSFLSKRDQQNQKVAREVLTDSLENQHQQLFNYNRFTDNLESLYRGTSQGKPGYSFAMNVNENSAIIDVIPKRPSLPYFSGAVFIVSGDNLPHTIGGICQNQGQLATPIQLSIADSPVIECPPGSELITSLASGLFTVTTEDGTQNIGGLCMVYHSSNQLRRSLLLEIAPPEPGTTKIQCPAGSSLIKSWVIPVEQ